VHLRPTCALRVTLSVTTVTYNGPGFDAGYPVERIVTSSGRHDGPGSVEGGT
jgi:hypothetical protein